MTRVCSDCSTAIGRRGKTGRCRLCALKAHNRNPEWQANRVAGLAVAMQDAGVRARHRDGCKRGAAKRMADPVKAEVLRELGRTYGPRNAPRLHTADIRGRAGKSVQRFHLAWCPEEHWGLNAKLKANGYRLPDRKRMIGDEIARLARVAGAEETARLAAMTPFERQMERVKNGAQLTTVPDTRPVAHNFTLGGVASGMI